MTYNEILTATESIMPEVQNIRRALHRNPELSFKEYKTTEYIISRLNEMGIENKQITETGVIGIIGSGDNCVALRADIDALPITEETGLPYSSENSGVMHACGHDMHTSMLLGAAKILKANEANLKGAVKLIFQHAEELLPGGALAMISNGVLENPAPKIIFGQHIYPQAPAGTISLASGPVLASADEIYITLTGKSCHAAQPHLGYDPIFASAQLINYLQYMITKLRDPLQPAVLNIASISGGNSTNIIPDIVKIKGTLRTYNEELRLQAHKFLEENVVKFMELYNITADVNLVKGYPATINHSNSTDFTREIAKELFGEDKVYEFIPKMWAEDFSYYLQKIPGVFWLLGVVPEGKAELPPLHNSKLNPEESAMKNGISLMVATTLEYLKK
jgi:amidohydrolase